MAGRSLKPNRIPYADRSGASGVFAYALGEGFIDLWFRDGVRYRYDASAPGPEHVAEMRRLAQAGKGLATYVNRHVRTDFARKL
jgi:hypothetical protein